MPSPSTTNRRLIVTDQFRADLKAVALPSPSITNRRIIFTDQFRADLTAVAADPGAKAFLLCDQEGFGPELIGVPQSRGAAHYW